MDWTTEVPKQLGLYRHRCKFLNRERMLFVGYVNDRFSKWQGTEKADPWQRLKCCKPDEYLHADRLTPTEWGGEWFGPL
jgi:hypothetical protein